MKRRTVLAGTGTLATAALAGCLSDPGRDVPSGGSTDPDGTPTDTPTPALADSTFEVLSVTSGQGDNSADVTFDGEVVVEGTIRGSNGCYTAKLKSAEYADGTLTVVVEAFEDREEDEVCTQALVDVEYEASFAFEGPLPERVVVEHVSGGESTTVAEETR